VTNSLLFVDANTIWHRKIAEALGTVMPTLAVLPRSGALPRASRMPDRDGKTTFATVTLPRGWASISAPVSQRILARWLLQWAETMPGAPAVLLSSPTYRTLAGLLHGRLPLIYYCADDYRSYQGWGKDIAEAEAEICGRAEHAVFVSEALRERALRDLRLDSGRCITSPNATEPRFFCTSHAAKPKELAGRRGPIVGILGALTDRLDIEIIRSVAALSGVGTFLIAGPVEASIAVREKSWLSDPKVVMTGAIPHETIHSYALAMDIALIPYQATPLNFHCSPMRLYDHLATGAPIFATDACDQINRRSLPGVTVSSPAELVAQIAEGLGAARQSREPSGLLWSTRAQAMCSTIQRTICESIAEPAQAH
jgi:hypothetical protein